MLTLLELKSLINKASNNRVKILKMANKNSAHLGGSLSCLDILTVLYNKILKHDPKNPKMSERDRFILSAGHKAIALYVTLQDLGYFNEDVLWEYNKLNSIIYEHPEDKLPGVEFPTGSLGYGLSVGGGMAIAAKLDKKDYKVFVLLGDGECDEGLVWEAAMAASHHKLDNLVAIIDRNGLQVNGKTKDIMDTSPLEDKFKSFGWEVRVINGHDYNEIYESLINIPFEINKPSCIIANTIKCRGVTSAENDFSSHHCYWGEERINEAIKLVKENTERELSLIK